jgi:hypothetical protein
MVIYTWVPHLHSLNSHLDSSIPPSSQSPSLIVSITQHIPHMAIPFPCISILGISNLHILLIYILYYLDIPNRYSSNVLMPSNSVPSYGNNWPPSISISHPLVVLMLPSQSTDWLSHTFPISHNRHPTMRWFQC